MSQRKLLRKEEEFNKLNRNLTVSKEKTEKMREIIISLRKEFVTLQQISAQKEKPDQSSHTHVQRKTHVHANSMDQRKGPSIGSHRGV